MPKILLMKPIKLPLFALLICLSANYSVAQSQLSGRILGESEPLPYVNIVLYVQEDSSLYKVETTDLLGKFTFPSIESNTYRLVSSYMGMNDLTIDNLVVDKETIDLGDILMQPASIELATATVTTQRALVEVKPDRTVFNVQGTINSVGENGLNLLRKAPGVLLDNNNNVSVLGRSGVLFYVDGKRLPLAGDDLTAYLENLTAEQIDRIDIITNPGARYEAEGNAGIIDIRLKKDKSLGYNGSVSGTYSKGLYHKSNLTASGNYRNKLMNVFGNTGFSDGIGYSDITFDSYQNGFRLLSSPEFIGDRKAYNYRLGTDFFLSDNQTLGILISSTDQDANNRNINDNLISSFTDVSEYDSTPADITIPYEQIDSILIANNDSKQNNKSFTYNINYAYNKKGSLTNIDLDYGKYSNTSIENQPNEYLDRDENILRSVNFYFDTPREIDIWTAKIDHERDALDGKLGFGFKYSSVNTDNTFLFYDGAGLDTIRNDFNSNLFTYDENVTAGYVSYARPLTEKVNLSVGSRVEHTKSTGKLTAFRDELQEEPVEQNYVSLFPSLGITYQIKRGNTWSINYGRRINRPDYNVLNPFRQQVTELDFYNGNPRLRPEIVNNFEIGYTHQYRFNFKLAYSLTTDKITRIFATDSSNEKASFINWDNLAEQQIWNLSASLPFQIKSWWSAFFNVSTEYKKNSVDNQFGKSEVSNWGYNFYQQQTFTLGKGFTAECSSWYSGPGIWGGVFKYESSYSLNFGLQKRFLNDKLNIKVGVNDIFNQSYWSGFSDFGGLLSYGQGYWDSRRGSISISYNFGSSEVKKSRKRKTGIEEESKRAAQN